MPDTPVSKMRWYWASLLLATGFIVTGVLELDLVRAAGAAEATLLEWFLLPWAPLGIAVSVMLICGNARSWPGAAVGSLVVNATAHLPAAMLISQASGNVLCAVAIFTLLRRWHF